MFRVSRSGFRTTETGKPTRAVEISGSDGGTLEIDRMTDEQIDQGIKELMAELGLKTEGEK